MLFFYILIGTAIFVVLLFANFIWSSFFVGKQKGEAKQLTRDRLFHVTKKMDEGKPDFWSDYKTKTISQYKYVPLLGLTDNNRHYLQLLLDASEIDDARKKTPEEVHFDQLMYVVPYILMCVALSFVWKYALIALLGAYFIYKMPVSRLKKKYEQGMIEVEFQFPGFYDVVYVQYRQHDANVLLSDIVYSYLPIATGAFKRLLKRFAIDLEQGEDYALRQLDARHGDVAVIHKFCSILRLRLQGDEASFVAMATFRESLQAIVKDWMMADLEKRKKIANRITATMVTAILSIVMIVYFITFMKMTM